MPVKPIGGAISRDNSEMSMDWWSCFGVTAEIDELVMVWMDMQGRLTDPHTDNLYPADANFFYRFY